MQSAIRQMIRGAAVLALCSASYAYADRTIYPGVSCTSSGAVNKPINGSLMNAELSNGTSKYNCIALRTNTSSGLAYTASATIYLQRNITFTDVNCVLRGIDKLGNVVSSASGLVPHWSDVNSPKTYTRIVSMTVTAPTLVRSYSLRCDIPNVEGGEYGIISYEIND